MPVAGSLIDVSSAPAFDACLTDGLDIPGGRTLIVDLRALHSTAANGVALFPTVSAARANTETAS